MCYFPKPLLSVTLFIHDNACPFIILKNSYTSIFSILLTGDLISQELASRLNNSKTLVGLKNTSSQPVSIDSWEIQTFKRHRLNPCSQSKHGCFRPRKKGLIVNQKLCIYHSEGPEIESSLHHLFFSVMKHAGF